MRLPRSLRARSLMWLAAVVALVGAVTAARIYRDWIPYDEGVMAQSAQRVAEGELPHRDFDELWTGGVSELHAIVFRVAGPSLRVMRTVLLVAFLLTLPFLFLSAREFVGPMAAAGVTLLGAAWSVISWPLPLPSWYVLFAELVGCAAMLIFLRTRRRRWLVAAGVCAGAAVLAKIVGLYFIAASLLTIAYSVQQAEAREPAPDVRSAPWYALLIVTSVFALLAMVAGLARSMPGLTPWIHFVTPVASLGAVLVWREWNAWRVQNAPPLPRLFRLAGWTGVFVAGVMIPVVLFSVPYARAHAIGALWRGMFVTPQVRLVVTQFALPGLRTSLVAVLPLIVLVIGACFVEQPLRRRDRMALAVLSLALVAGSYDGSPLVLVVWNGVRMAVPFLVIGGAMLLLRQPLRRDDQTTRESSLFFLLAATAMCSLIQIPFALYTYVLYFAPIAVVAGAALGTMTPRFPRAVLAALAIVLTGFGIRRPASERAEPSRAPTEYAWMSMARGGIRVDRGDSAVYAQLDSLVGAHAGEWIYVWHDSPEVAFLTGRRNPTRTLFEAFDDSVTRSTPDLQLRLRRAGVRVVVLHDSTAALRPMDPVFRSWIDRTYPRHARAGSFDVRWQ